MSDGSGEQAKRRRMSESRMNPHAPPPSRVVHARSVPDQTLSTDMATALSHFGPISHIMLMPKLRQALIEFETVESAIRCVGESKEQGVQIRNHTVYFNYSKSQEINRGSSDDTIGPNKILLFTIQNALYPITCDVLHAICHPCGNVLRIVMIRKRGVQALVEFDTVESATKAKVNLNFADIYAGCCTLKIEYSRTDQLNVSMNTDDTRDYTNNALPTRRESSGPAHQMSGGYGGQQQQQAGYGQQQQQQQQQGGWAGQGEQYMPHGGRGSQGQMAMGMAGMQQYGMQQGGMDQYGAMRRASSGGIDYQGRGSMGSMGGYSGAPMGGMSMQQGGMAMQGGPMGVGGAPEMGIPGSVMMFYELSGRFFTCARLFNLVCLYANPIKVKFIVNKPGMAMVQVDDPFAAQTVIQHLQGLEIFGAKIECGPSKHPYIADSRNSQRLPDGSGHTLDCVRSLNHRFKNGQYQRSRLCKPTATLHFFNAPRDTPHTTYLEMFKANGAPTPQTVLTFRDDQKPSDRGLIQFATEADAVNALALCNHVEITSAQGRVNTIKFSFSLQEIDPNDPAATRAEPASMPGIPAPLSVPGVGAGAGAMAPQGEVAFASTDFAAPDPGALPVPQESGPV